MTGIRKMLIALIFTFCLVIGALFVYMTTQTPDIYQGPRSDHFNGKTFSNPDVSNNNKSVLDILRWWATRKRSIWPKHVENKTAFEKMDKLAGGARITFVNHSTTLIQTPTVTLLTDPVWSERVSPFKFIGPKRVRKPGVAFNDLPEVHVILISHNHYDHLDIASLKKLDKAFHPILIVPLGNKRFLARQGLTNVVEMDWWQQYELRGVAITLFPAKHWSARSLNDKSRTLWGSYGIRTAQLKIYFAGDTGFSSLNFTKIQRRWGSPDIALLPIGAYEPRWFMQSSHMNPEEAVEASQLLQAKHSIPIHYGTFQLSDEGINTPLEDLEKALTKNHIAIENFLPLKEGASRLFK